MSEMDPKDISVQSEKREPKTGSKVAHAALSAVTGGVLTAFACATAGCLPGTIVGATLVVASVSGLGGYFLGVKKFLKLAKECITLAKEIWNILRK